MKIIEALQVLEQSDKKKKVVQEAYDEVFGEDLNFDIKDTLIPMSMEERAGKDDNYGGKRYSKMFKWEEIVAKALSSKYFMEKSENCSTDGTAKLAFREISRDHWNNKGTDDEYIRILKMYPESSFVKGMLNMKAWGRNPIYRSNVNYEGCSYRNAAMFHLVAKKYEGMNKDDINLVLRAVSFNNRGPRDPLFLGTNALFEEIELLKEISFNLNHAITVHRKKTGRRYSRRSVTDEDADNESRKIVKEIRRIVQKYQGKPK